MKQPKLYLMMGYPGAGKTTAAKVIRNMTGALYISSDDLRAQLFPKPTFTQAEHDKLYKQLNKITEAALKAGRDVIYDANLNRREHRQEKYDICAKVGAQPLLLWVQTSRAIARQRAKHAGRQHLWPKNETPDSMFDRIADVIESPEVEEPHVVVDGTKVSPQYIAQIIGI